MSSKLDEVYRAYSYGLLTYEQMKERAEAVLEYFRIKDELTREAC